MSAPAVTVYPERDLTRPLLAFWVGDVDMFAAEDAERALAMARIYNAPSSNYRLDDVRPVAATTLDAPLMDGDHATTLRAKLQAARQVGWLARGVWVEVDLTAAPLAAFWVGDMDIYAARSAADALVQCVGHSAMPDTYELDDVTPVTEAELAMTLIGEDGHPDGTLAELLATATEPGWLMGTE